MSNKIDKNLWKIVQTEDDLPDEGQLVLIYVICNGQELYYAPRIWNNYDFIATTYKENCYILFAWCEVEPPIE